MTVSSFQSHIVTVLSSTWQCYLSITVEKEPEDAVISVLRYSIHLWDLKHPGTWENKGTYVYYTDFIMELAMLFLDLVHHIHMLVRWCSQVFLFLYLTLLLIRLCLFSEQLFGNIWLSMASLVIFMQLRYLFHEVQRRVRRHKNYLHVISNMEARSVYAVISSFYIIKNFHLTFSVLLKASCFATLLFCRFAVATAEELAANDDDCAICWDSMLTARKLPCGHLFHK